MKAKFARDGRGQPLGQLYWSNLWYFPGWPYSATGVNAHRLVLSEGEHEEERGNELVHAKRMDCEFTREGY